MKRFLEIIETSWKVLIVAILMSFVVCRLIQIENNLRSINRQVYFIASYVESIE